MAARNPAGTDRDALWALPLSGVLLLWPAIWNGYPIVFADTGTYLSQAINRHLGWDRPPIYSLFMLPLHLTLTAWPVVAVQALATVRVLQLVCRCGWRWMPAVVAPLAAVTWLPFLVSQLMPDLFTPLLVLVLSVAPLQLRWVAFAAFAIAAQQSSLLLWLALLPALLIATRSYPASIRVRLLVAPTIAVAVLMAINLSGHRVLAISPYGNVFLLARVIYDGPGMDVLRRDCPTMRWRLCPYLDRFPPTSDEFLWRADSPIILAGGHKAVSADAGAIVSTAVRAEPGRELRAVLRNGAEQLSRFRSGDGLEAWPTEVTPWIERDFPLSESARYAAGLQAQGQLTLPAWMPVLHATVALAGTLACVALLPVAVRRRHGVAWLLTIPLLALPISAVITGGLSTPHDRYQSRIMWLPPFVAAASAGLLRRRAG